MIDFIICVFLIIMLIIFQRHKYKFHSLNMEKNRLDIEIYKNSIERKEIIVKLEKLIKKIESFDDAENRFEFKLEVFKLKLQQLKAFDKMMEEIK